MRIDIEGVEFGYSANPVLKNINLSVNGPQLLSIIGPNGVGKSTLIHCINKILSPTKGVVYIDGQDVASTTLKELAKKVGYVPYASSDAFPLSVVDTVLMGRHPHSNWKSLDHDLDVVYETLRLINIEHLAMRSFDELSAGQHQKVMLARGLVQEPKVLLLDEPTSNLDIKHQMEVTRIMRDLSQEKGILVIMISHDLNIAAKYSDHMIMLYDGGVYAAGTPEEVLTAENIKTVYGVESDVIMSHGRPHIIMLDPLFDDNIKPLDDDVYVSSDNRVVDRMERDTIVRNVLKEPARGVTD
ncbi:MAG: ABC transporter ATP-binding protein [Candidatus Methanomethylophilaceae archaeon]|nr:ABC transporter ATP-binding protein [Candidatus Methanomethylophilaceae archaeon]